jgi:hypothetical protein
MSSATCPATAWRNVLLEVVALEAEGGATGPSWQTPAGAFADEYADSIRTSLVRGLAEGRMVTLRISEEGGASVLITRAAARRPEAVPADALAQIEVAWDAARDALKAVEAQRDAAIRWLTEQEARLAGARAEAERLKGMVARLRGAAQAEA